MSSPIEYESDREVLATAADRPKAGYRVVPVARPHGPVRPSIGGRPPVETAVSVPAGIAAARHRGT
jgi:xanthine/CO dehydrogenase XdhC/CoxF family maturation factor